MCLHRHWITNFYGDLVCADCLTRMPERKSVITEDDVNRLIEQGAANARDLDKQLEKTFTLDASQRNLVLR